MLTLVSIPFYHDLQHIVTLVHQPPAKATPENVLYDSDGDSIPPLIPCRELYPDSSDSESDSEIPEGILLVREGIVHRDHRSYRLSRSSSPFPPTRTAVRRPPG